MSEKTEEFILAIEKDSRENVFVQKNESMCNHTTFRIGGPADAYIEPATEEAFCRVMAEAARRNIRTIVIGRGSNLLFDDAGFRGAVISTTQLRSIRIEGNTVHAGAGASLNACANAACEAGLTGMEFAFGIPGSVGGAVFMNAGAHGSSMENVVVSTRAYNRKEKRTVTITDNMFGYRDSIYKNNSELVCLGANILLSRGEPQRIRAKMRELLEQRRSKQPIEYPSAGSYFKRPEGDFAGRLIEISGLKGVRVGGAEVSEKHAGFIINKGNATFNDIIMLERIVIDSVYEKTGVLLQREVEIVE